MNVFNRVTLRSLKENKTRTVVTVIGIILSAAMICAVTTFAGSFRNYLKEQTVYSDGNWHGNEIGTDYDTCEEVIKADKVEKAVLLQQLGYAYAEGCDNEFKPYIYLLGAGDGADDVLPIHITSGRYPENTDEIILPNHLYINGGVKYDLGDTVTLGLGKRMLDGFSMPQKSPCYVYENGKEVFNGETLEVSETRTYTVVGFYDRISTLIESINSPGYTAFTAADKTPSENYRYDVYFRMKKPDNVYAFMEEMKFTGDTNRDLLMSSGSFRFNNFTTMLYSLAAIVIALIMFGSVALIYNAFSISVSERTKQFGLLSSVGATKRQLRRMVLYEALSVSAVGIPLGVLAGIGGIGVTLIFVGDKFRSMGFEIDMKLSVSPAAVIAAALVAVVTVLISAWIPSKRATKVSAVVAIRQNLDVNAKGKEVKTSKLTYKLFGLPGVLANKHYKRSKKKYRATVFSLFMSIVLFVSASSFTDYLTESVSGGFGSVGYDLSMYAFHDEFNNDDPDELLDRMKSAKSVTGGAYSHDIRINAEIKTDDLTDRGLDYLNVNQGQPDDISFRQMDSYVTFIDDAAFKDILKQNGLNEEKFTDAADPLALAIDGVRSFNGDTRKYEKTYFYNNDGFEFVSKRGKKIEGYYFSGEVEDENGNTFVRYIKNDPDYDGSEYLDFSKEEAYVSTTHKVGKVISSDMKFVGNDSTMRYVYPFSLAEAVFSDYDDSEIPYHYMLTSSNHKESYTALQSVLNDNGMNSSYIHDYAEMEESNRNIITIVQVFSYGFIVLISLIAAANVFNTISTNISLRRREFAMLKSVGMAQKGFNKMMNFECLLYGSRALLYGLPVSCGVTYLIYLSVMEGYETVFRLPLKTIGIAVFSVFIVVFATMMYSMSKIKKDNPIDALKNENL